MRFSSHGRVVANPDITRLCGDFWIDALNRPDQKLSSPCTHLSEIQQTDYE
jgi:hypothetical protein